MIYAGVRRSDTGQFSTKLSGHLKKKIINLIFARQSVGRIRECVTIGISFLDSMLDEYIFESQV